MPDGFVIGVDTVKSVTMAEGDTADWKIVAAAYPREVKGVADRVLKHLEEGKKYRFGYQIDRYQHGLQTATRAFREGVDEETVVCALLHDIGDDLAPYTHGDFAAAILRPFVSAENHWLIQNHRLFQGYHFFQFMGQDRNARDKYQGHPAYARTCDFCDRWDQAAFDPNYDTMPIEAFAPMVHRLFDRDISKVNARS